MCVVLQFMNDFHLHDLITLYNDFFKLISFPVFLIHFSLLRREMRVNGTWSHETSDEEAAWIE